MSSLSELQYRFHHSVITNSDLFYPDIAKSGELSIDERLAIYVDGYRLRLIEALQDSYPALHTLMGDEDFEQLCLAYIDHSPSTHFSIRYFGSSLTKFITNEYKSDDAELLSEMASFEWALRFSFDAIDEKPLNIGDFSQLSADQWGGLRFQLHPSLQMLNFHWNVPSLWKAIEQEAEPEEAQRYTTQTTWLIWRPELETHFRSMDEAEMHCLQAIHNGKTFSYLCEFALDSVDHQESAQIAAEYLARWINEGVLVRII